jgi:hypothetical protein
MTDLLELGHRLGGDALGRRVGRDEAGMLLLERLQLVEQCVVCVVADLGVVEDVVTVTVVLDCPAQLGGALGRVPPLLRGGRAYGSITSLAAGSTSRSRS